MPNAKILAYAGKSDVGKKRNQNEDNFALLADENMYLVADGMGGHACGEVASRIAVETLTDFFVATRNDHDLTWPFRENRQSSYAENRLVTGIKLANLRIFETAQSDVRYRGMGTTLVAALWTPEYLYVGHVGDSRAYLWQNQTLRQLTEDHSLLNDYLKIHELSAKEIAQFPHKNVIVRALGMKDSVVVDVRRLEVSPGDCLLLCSDGLTSMVNDVSLSNQLKNFNSTSSLIENCQALIDAANAEGGQDNITVVMLQF